MGIGIFRHTPYAFYRLIRAYQFLHHIHIRAVFLHRHRYHLYSKMFRNLKVPVISGHRTQKFYFIQLTPRRISQNTMGHAPGNRIIHDRKAGIPAYDNVIRTFGPHHRRHHFFCLRNTIQKAIIPTVHTGFCLIIRNGPQHIHNAHFHIHLRYRRLPSGHIQFQSLPLCIFILFQ